MPKVSGHRYPLTLFEAFESLIDLGEAANSRVAEVSIQTHARFGRVRLLRV
jgi:hypothetical protein